MDNLKVNDELWARIQSLLPVVQRPTPLAGTTANR